MHSTAESAVANLTALGLVEVLHEDDLVPLLVVDQLIDSRAHGQQSETAGTNTLGFPYLHVGDGIVSGADASRTDTRSSLMRGHARLRPSRVVGE